MKIRWVLVVSAVMILTPLLIQKTSVSIEQDSVPQELQLNTLVRGFLISKESPLAQETDFLLQQKHWKLLIAISAIESQYCKRQLGYNCFGIGGDSAYRYYNSYKESIVDAENLIMRWQSRGRWLTIEDMNCHYVVPCNQNWVTVVNQILEKMNEYEQQSFGTVHHKKS